MVKTVFTWSAILFFSFAATRSFGQVNIVTDLNWQAGPTQTGPWGPAFDVGPCTNNCVIQCFCPNWNGNLNVNTCAGALPIWGTPPPANCVYPPATFFFQRVFDMGQYDPNDPCTTVTGTVIWQADNNSQIWINGQTAGNLTSPANGWNIPNGPIDISAFLQPGLNTIIVQVTNLGAGGCPNFAFLSLCLNAGVVQQDPDASFTLNSTGVPGGSILSSGNVQSPALSHDWYFMIGDNETGPWTPVGVIQGSLNFTGQFVPECQYYRVIQHVYDGRCEECFERVFYDCGELQKSEEVRAVIDCAELDNYEWPIIGFGGSGSGFKVQIGNEPATAVQVHPNPARETLNVQWDKLEPANCRIVDLTGKAVMEQKIEQGTLTLELDISRLPAGVYLLELTGGLEKVVKKFSVAK